MGAKSSRTASPGMPDLIVGRCQSARRAAALRLAATTAEAVDEGSAHAAVMEAMAIASAGIDLVTTSRR